MHPRRSLKGMSQNRSVTETSQNTTVYLFVYETLLLVIVVSIVTEIVGGREVNSGTCRIWFMSQLVQCEEESV